MFISTAGYFTRNGKLHPQNAMRTFKKKRQFKTINTGK